MRKPFMLHTLPNPAGAGYRGAVLLYGRTVAVTATASNDRNAAIRAALRLSQTI